MNEFVRLPKRDEEGHKGTFGKILIIGGCRGMTGAVILAAKAAMRSGVGLCYIASPKALLPVYEVCVPAAVKIAVGSEGDEFFREEHYGEIVKISENMDSIAIGMGLGRRPETAGFLKKFLENTKAEKLLIDADGLRLLGSFENIKIHAKSTIITPHMGEASYLIGKEIENSEEERIKNAKSLCEKYNCITLLKGHRTLVQSNDGRWYINNVGGSELSKGGSGDTLSGIIASLMAQGLDAFEAGCTGAYIHARAGEAARKKLTAYCSQPEDYIEALPEAFSSLI